MKYYRIVQRLTCGGSELMLAIQRWRWWFPFWLDISDGCLHLDLQSAEKHIKAGCPSRYREYQKEKLAAEKRTAMRVKEARKIIKYIDKP